jgi:hypothetical protein
LATSVTLLKEGHPGIGKRPRKKDHNTKFQIFNVESDQFYA